MVGVEFSEEGAGPWAEGPHSIDRERKEALQVEDVGRAVLVSLELLSGTGSDIGLKARCDGLGDVHSKGYVDE
jgi:hypothetical protein